MLTYDNNENELISDNDLNSSHTVVVGTAGERHTATVSLEEHTMAGREEHRQPQLLDCLPVPAQHRQYAQ